MSQEQYERRANGKIKRNRHHSIWKRIISILGCVTVFCTVYALILPAITLESPVSCGFEEHTHTEECYEVPTAVSEFLCASPHTHEENCYDAGEIVCGYWDAYLHIHDESCMQGEELICPLPEEFGHLHTDSCYEPVTEYACGLEESEAHLHGEECYTEEATLLCELSDEPHLHDETCYTEETTQICELEESEEHAHTETCFQTDSLLVCALEEVPAHEHTEECWDIQQILLCELPEGHVHTDECGVIENTMLVCGEPELTPHVHDDSCFDGELPVCGFYEVIEHVHSEECVIFSETEETVPVLTCTEEHEHTEECYTDLILVCELPEHTHDDLCHAAVSSSQAPAVPTLPSDPTADTETPEQWEKMAEDLELTGIFREDLLIVAKSQIGYTESVLNYELTETGAVQGYTRYGAWAEEPYADWNNLFLGFCLHYAEVPEEEFPWQKDLVLWTEQLQEAQLTYGKEYTAEPGDLIFFDRDEDGTVDHAALVTETAFDGTITYIEGDSEAGAVAENECMPTDPFIAGYAVLPEQWLCGIAEHIHEDICYDVNGAPVCEDSEHQHSEFCTGEPLSDIDNIPAETLLDISDGPAVFISATCSAPSAVYQARALSLQLEQDLQEHLGSRDGSLVYLLLDLEDQFLPEDENGNLIAAPETEYKLTISVISENGILPGTYTCKLPDGAVPAVAGTTRGSFVLESTDLRVGTWSISDDGQITLEFNNGMNNMTGVKISVAMGITFHETEEPVVFDDDVSVVVQPVSGESSDTEITKQQSDTAVEGGRIGWIIDIIGGTQSRIPGNVLTDELDTSGGQHHYTQKDMDAGIALRAVHTDENGEVTEHSWIVKSEDTGLIWTEFGWEYTIPETVECASCQEPITLGNDGWRYHAAYTSTLTDDGAAGVVVYTNTASIDDVSATGRAQIRHGDSAAAIEKSGEYSAGAYRWSITALIPGMTAEQANAVNSYFVRDTMRIISADGSDLAPAANDSNSAVITASYTDADGNLTEITVPRAGEASVSDPFTWECIRTGYSEYAADANGSQVPAENAVPYERDIGLFSRCSCTETTCSAWNGERCGTDSPNEAFCNCWTFPYDVTFTIQYTTTDEMLSVNYGGAGNVLNNTAALYHMQTDGSEILEGDSGKTLAIPGLFLKEKNPEPNGQILSYTITVNEAGISLAEDGQPVVIRDAMTDTLAYVSGSLVITAESAPGVSETLTEDTDYTVTYDGSGEQTDTEGNVVHVLEITLLDPKPLKYTLHYDASIVVPTDYDGQGIPYANTAEIGLFGRTLSSTVAEAVFADVDIVAKQFHVLVRMTDASTGDLLPDAVFTLYTADGNIVDTKTTLAQATETQEMGTALFESDLTAGIILQEHQLYYLQETLPPHGYISDNARYWFYFCSSEEPCERCTTLVQEAEEEILRIPAETVGQIVVENSKANYVLPKTGGTGLIPIYSAGGALMSLSAAYCFLRGRKKRREEAPSLPDAKNGTTK